MNNAQEKLAREIIKAREAAEAAGQAELPWDERERSVSLTNAEWHRLVCYILMTTKYREGERKAWEHLASEVDASGAPVFPNAKANAEYWAEVDGSLELIKQKIDA